MICNVPPKYKLIYLDAQKNAYIHSSYDSVESFAPESQYLTLKTSPPECEGRPAINDVSPKPFR
jgi:hypothetical protein